MSCCHWTSEQSNLNFLHLPWFFCWGNEVSMQACCEAQESCAALCGGPDNLHNWLRLDTMHLDCLVWEQWGYIRIIQALNTANEYIPQSEKGWMGLQTALGYPVHSNVPLTGSPSPVMNTPRALVPVHERISNSFSPMIWMIGFISNGVSSTDWRRGKSWNKEAWSRSTML